MLFKINNLTSRIEAYPISKSNFLDNLQAENPK
jgi:hypothetical protein